jgi:hypothetical protein
LKVFENRVPRRMFIVKEGKKQEIGENCVVRSFIICIISIKSRGMGRSLHVARMWEMKNDYRILAETP